MVIPSGSPALTQHPARQGVMDFLRVIVLDSLPLNVTGKAAPVCHWHYLLYLFFLVDVIHRLALPIALLSFTFISVVILEESFMEYISLF